ncbi:MAG TPA: YheU family protein [Moraxellaceae bacterium]|nr:YheU family protein [Moraxellaceae bacterium]
MIIPPELLDADTLTRLLEDFVTRDGTDNGDDTPLDVRVRRARHALDRREAVIVFHPLTQQCDLMLRRDVPPEWLDEESAG